MDVALYVATGNPVNAIGKPIEFDASAAEGIVTDPTLTMREEDAQALIDALWQAGFKPTQGRQSEGITAAQAKHLEDMRALTFATLDIQQPKGE